MLDPITRLLALEATILWATAVMFVVGFPWGGQRDRADEVAEWFNMPSVGADPHDIPWVAMLAWAGIVTWVRITWL